MNHLFLKIAALAIFVFLSGSSYAVEEPPPDSPWFHDAWDNFKSPVTTKAKYVLLGGAGLTASLLIFEDQIIDPVQNETIEHKPLGSTSKMGDLAGQGIPNAAYLVGMLSYGLLARNSESLQAASGMFQATAYSALVTTGLKYTVREQRPYNHKLRNSFPSGHTTSAFAFASYVGCRHSLPWGIAAYALATFVGYSRMNDNAHYLHDVVAGAAIGASYGIGVCLAENRRVSEAEERKRQVNSSWYLAPARGGMMVGLNVNY